jgi:hypothetical protein
MKHTFKYAILFTLSFCLFACSGTIKLIYKSSTENEKISYYVEKMTTDNSDVKRIYASVDSNGHKSYYSFYPDNIVMTTDKATYKVFYGQLPANHDSDIFRKFSSLDSLVLKRGDNLLDSLGLKTFKRSTGADSYEIEVIYYHGFPKNKKFRP